jgi:hypothetical protein
LRWVKVHVTLRHHRLLRRCSVTARYLFRICLEIVGDFEQGDALAMRGPKGPVPMTASEIAEEAGIKERECAFALGELMECGLIDLRQPDCYFVPKFIEKTATSTDRVRKHRMKRDETVSETHDETVSETRRNGLSNAVSKRTEVEEEKEIDTPLPAVGESHARRSDAWEFGIWVFERGLEYGLVADHVDLAYAGSIEVEIAEKLLKTYGRKRCEAVAMRFITQSAERKAQGKGVRRFSIATLADMWSMFESDRPTNAQDAAIEKALEAIR